MENLPKTYDKSREQEIYSKWMEKGYFKATPNPGKKPYTIMLPPPNITSKLHLGHALNNGISDMLIRFKRMQGYETLMQPGTDHAAIATEVVVVNMLEKEGITKESLGRDAFLERMWQWYEEYGGTIVRQLKTLGISADWDKLRFTMDKGLSEAVLEVFVRLYKDGKIYKGERLVNWCTKCQTSISDAEVEHEDREGNLWHFKYPMEDGGFISFATTRPETMLGDTAIAVSPKDERYTNLVGKFVVLPWGGRKIPIIADSYVDPEYGTGVVKITPAHDPNDFEVGQRHSLPRINIMNDDGTINESGGIYQGQTREQARKNIIAEMTEKGLYIKTEALTHSVGEHDRCNSVIEPLLKLQWFVKMEELAKPALEAYTSGKLKFNRERFGKIYKHWLDNIRDWCISRQLWWGHRIPAWYDAEGNIYVANNRAEAEDQFLDFRNKLADDALEELNTKGHTGITDRLAVLDSKGLKQDDDVLDTWFSSALWPFSTIGWPEKTPELDYFYPGNTLVTAPEIIFTWVVRMVFMGIEYMGDIPFTDVLIHGIVRDDQGRKMSKSLGNGIDPVDIIETHGADALRLMLVSGNALDNDTRFYFERLDFSRNFLNKLWNATRFVFMSFEGDEASLALEQVGQSPISNEVPAALPGGSVGGVCPAERQGMGQSPISNEVPVALPGGSVGGVCPAERQGMGQSPISNEDAWILSRLNGLIKEVTGKLEEHEIGLAAQKIIDFVWDEFCDWYVEMVKPRLYNKDESMAASRAKAQATLRHVLINTLKLLHPIAPFITEDLFLALEKNEDTIMLSQWPVYDPSLDSPQAEKDIERIKEGVRGIRAIRAEKQVPPSQKIAVVIQPNDEQAKVLFSDSSAFIGVLAGAKSVEILDGNPPSGAISIVVPGATLYLPMDSLVDAEKEKARLTKEKKRLEQELARIDGKLSNQGFIAKAPENLIAAEREKRENFAVMLAKVEEELKQ